MTSPVARPLFAVEAPPALDRKGIPRPQRASRRCAIEAESPNYRLLALVGLTIGLVRRQRGRAKTS